MNKGIILLVEDDPDQEALVLRALKKNDIQSDVIVAHDGAEALDYIFDKKIIPGVVLLDLQIPRVDGLEVLKRIRNEELTKNLPVFVLTASDLSRDIIESYNLGVSSYIRKPVDIEQFDKVITDFINYWNVLSVRRL